jgi:uncharacterized protein (TIGR00369 family)
MSQRQEFGERVRAWLAGEVKLAPITELLGIRPVAIEAGLARLEMPVDSRFHNAMGTVHGGIFCDLADVAFGAALATVTEDGESFATLQLQMSYLQPVRDGRLLATAKLLRRSKTTAHLECEIHDASGALMAKATSVLVFKRRVESAP